VHGGIAGDGSEFGDTFPKPAMFSQIRLELASYSPLLANSGIVPKLAKDHLVNWVGATHLLSPWTSGWNDYSLEFWIKAGHKS